MEATPILIMLPTVLLAVSVSGGAVPAVTGLAIVVGWVLGVAIVALGIKVYDNLIWRRADRRWKRKKKEAKKKEVKEMKAKERERKEREDKIAEILRRAR